MKSRLSGFLVQLHSASQSSGRDGGRERESFNQGFGGTRGSDVRSWPLSKKRGERSSGRDHDRQKNWTARKVAHERENYRERKAYNQERKGDRDREGDQVSNQAFDGLEL